MFLTKLQKKKLQIELNPKKDEKLYNLVEKLEKEGAGEKGYINDQIKKRLEMYQALSEAVGEEDPLEIVKKLLSNILTNGVPSDIEKDSTPNDEDVDNAMDLLNNINKNFI